MSKPDRLKHQQFTEAIKAGQLVKPALFGNHDYGFVLMAEYANREEGTKYVHMIEAKTNYLRRFRTLDTAAALLLKMDIEHFEVIMNKPSDQKKESNQ